MPEFPAFLPPILNLEGDGSDIIDFLYSVFCRDFKVNSLFHNDIIVRFDDRIKADGSNKEEGFWHLIEKEDERDHVRRFDIKRAERLPWVKPILEAYEEESLKIFDYDHGNRSGIRRYLWLKEFDYVVILKERNGEWFILTAFYIDCNGKRQDLKKRYNKRLGS